MTTTYYLHAVASLDGYTALYAWMSVDGFIGGPQ
jgi:hypothetical protein